MITNDILKKVCIINASSNNDSSCFSIANNIFPKANIIDLKQKNIGFFDYNNANANDDFLDTLNEMLSSDLIIFASPVYWYNVTGELKVFFDRWTDTLMFYKDKKVQFSGKFFGLISTYGNDCGYIEQIIDKTCKYMGMESIGSLMISNKELEDKQSLEVKIQAFKNTFYKG